MFTKVFKLLVENIGFIAMLVLVVGLSVPIIYYTLEIFGLSGMREHLRLTGVLPLIGGMITGFISVWHIGKKTDGFH